MWGKGKIMILDTETTGLNNPEVIQFSAFVVDEKTFMVEKVINRYCMPPSNRIQYGATKIHLLTMENLSYLAEGTTFDDVYYSEGLNEFEGTVCGYNISFDLRAINYTLGVLREPYWIQSPKKKAKIESTEGNRVLDLMMPASRLVGPKGKVKLGVALDKVYGKEYQKQYIDWLHSFYTPIKIPDVSQEAMLHNAVYDVLYTYMIYLYLNQK